MAHVQASERDQAHILWKQLLTSLTPTAWYHTLTDATVRQRQVLSVADHLTQDGENVGIRGFVTDITTSIREETHRQASIDVARSAQKRAVIEQAKGALMALQGLNSEQAFLSLSQYSQNTNQKVTDIAQNILDACASPSTLRTLTSAIYAAAPTV